MALSYTPMTELEAVNIMLESIGEQAVSTLDDNGVDDAAVAYRSLHRINREVQSIGLHCNSEDEYPIAIDGDSKFAVPSNTLKVDYSYYDKDLVLRGGYLYDRYNHTYTISDTTVKVDIVFFLPFTDLPQCVREYITLRAARQFQMHQLGSAELDQFRAEDEARSRAEVVREELMSRDDSFLDNATAFSIVNRRA